MEIILARKGKDVVIQTKWHGSVGLTSKLDCGKEFEVKSEIKYLSEGRVDNSNPKLSRNLDRIPEPTRLPGGDKAICKYYLTPQRRGIYKVICKEIFRGIVQNSEVYKIIVL